MAALGEARTQVCQPVDRFELDLPEQAHGQVTALVGRLGGVVIDVTATGRRTRLVGHLPSTHVPELTRRLPDLTGGEAVLVSRLGHYAPSTGDTPPVRRRRGPDPADRDAWFRDVPR